MSSLFEELKRRNVFKVGIAYLVGAWILVQVADILFENIGTPGWVMQTLLVFLGIGFFVALFFAWAFEMTPEGVKLEKEVDRSQSITAQTSKKLNNVILVLMALAIIYLLYDKFSGPETVGSESDSQSVAAQSAMETDENLTLTPEISRQSIAVLPFTNRSPDPNDIYFTDGIHDDLLTKLAKLNAFSVISRTSVLEYRDTAKNLKQIGQELGVAHVMEGAVQRAGNRVRINVQLIDSDTDEHLWAEIYDRELTANNLFDIQSEIAQAIANALQATLSDEEVQSVAERPTENVEAYELYLQAQRFTFRQSEIGFRSAIDLYQEALKQDPEFKQAWIGLAKAHITRYWVYGGDPANRDLVLEAIEQARAIDPDFPELFMAEGFYWYWGFLDYEKAIRALQKAISMMPGNAEAHMWLGWALRRSGRWEESLEAMAESLRLNPRELANWVEYSQTLNYTDQVEAAFSAADKALELNPASYLAKTHLAWLYLDRTSDIESPRKLVIGAQHDDDDELNRLIYLDAQLLTRNFENVMDVATNWPESLEVALVFIAPRDMQIARAHYYGGNRIAAEEYARIALKSLAVLEKDYPGDYRIFNAQCLMQAILGDSEAVLDLVGKTLASKPIDAIQDFDQRFALARSLAIAGLAAEASEMLDGMLSKPNGNHIPYIEKDPSFDGIRETAEFVALMEKYR